MSKLTYTDKALININPEIPPENKVMSVDMNEIKTSVNAIYDVIGDITPTEIEYLTGVNANIQNQFNSGWIALLATLTYSSADAPTFVATTSVDLTGIISVGMKIKLTQTTVKYFIVTAITATTMTLYGGTDYTLENNAISNIYFSTQKAPFGFPMNPDKWSVIVKNTTETLVTNPVSNTWYNLGSIQITVPIGLWKINTSFIGQCNRAVAADVTLYTTLSTTNNGVTNTNMSTYGVFANVLTGSFCIYKEDIINILTKTVYYLNAKTQLTDLQYLIFMGNQAPTIIKATCAYL